LSCLDFISYYKDFKLLLCSSCNIALNLAQFKGHFTKHFLGTKGKAKDKLVLKAISILQELEVSSLSLSLDLINAFSITNTLFPFQELKTFFNLFKCSYCTYIVFSKKNLQKHIRDKHQNQGLNFDNIALSSSYIVVSKGQSLERNKYCFQVENQDKGKQVLREEKEQNSNNNSLNLEEEEEDLFVQASNLFIKEFDSKKDSLFNKYKNYSLNKEEPLSPLQKKTKYIQFLDNKNLQNLAMLCATCNKDEEPLLSILVMNIKELLYLSLDKSRYISNLPLQHLNSFQKGVVKNKPFKPLLKSDSRVKYFNFFSCFFAFVFRSFYNNKFKENKLYSLSKECISLLKELKQLALLQQEEASTLDLDLAKDFKKTKALFNKKLNSFKLNFFLSKGALLDKEDLEEDEEEDKLLSSSNNSLNSSLSSSTSSLSNKEEDSSSTISIDSTKSMSNTILAKIELLGKSNNLISIKIKEKLLSLFMLLFKQELSLYIFDSPLNSFFACKSINPRNYTLRGSLDLSRYYSFFLYSIQLIVLESSVQSAIAKQDSKLILLEI
jgi:hypothetical protein